MFNKYFLFVLYTNRPYHILLINQGGPGGGAVSRTHTHTSGVQVQVHKLMQSCVHKLHHVLICAALCVSYVGICIYINICED